MNEIQIIIGALRFVGRLEVELAPETCKVFSKLLPYRQSMELETVRAPLTEACTARRRFC